MWVNNLFGKDLADIAEESAADRIGQRIRYIRQVRGMSQAELGSAVGITGVRIAQYENGNRKPKIELLKQIAAVLHVETIALTDPVVSTNIGAMYAFFEMEGIYKLRPIEIDGKMYIDVGDDTMQIMLRGWYDELQAEKRALSDRAGDRKDTYTAYYDWKWNYPGALADETRQRLRKAQIQNQINDLQKQLEQIDDKKGEE